MVLLSESCSSKTIPAEAIERYPVIKTELPLQPPGWGLPWGSLAQFSPVKAKLSPLPALEIDVSTSHSIAWARLELWRLMHRRMWGKTI